VSRCQQRRGITIKAGILLQNGVAENSSGFVSESLFKRTSNGPPIKFRHEASH
jgi:hypothetical protein